MKVHTILAAAAIVFGCSAANAQISNDVVKIGVFERSVGCV